MNVLGCSPLWPNSFLRSTSAGLLSSYVGQKRIFTFSENLGFYLLEWVSPFNSWNKLTSSCFSVDVLKSRYLNGSQSGPPCLCVFKVWTDRDVHSWRKLVPSSWWMDRDGVWLKLCRLALVLLVLLVCCWVNAEHWQMFPLLVCQKNLSCILKTPISKL